MKDVTADGMFNLAVEKGPISTMPDIPGIAVWHQGHIGVYIGNGYVIHANEYIRWCNQNSDYLKRLDTLA